MKYIYTIVYTSVYILGWTVIPICDKLALQKAEHYALTWCVFALSALTVSTYVFIFTESPVSHISDALHQVPILVSGFVTPIVYLVYFNLLQASGVILIVMLQPCLLITQSIAGMVVLGETMDKWNIMGMVVILLGMVVFNGQTLIQMFEKKHTYSPPCPYPF